MDQRLNSLLIAAGLAGVLLTATGCPNGSPFASFFQDLFGIDTNNSGNPWNNGNNNGGNNNSGSQFIRGAVKTNIFVHPQAKILAGNDLVVFGTGPTSGVGYIVPSAGDTTSRTIPDDGLYRSYSFAIGNHNIYFVNDSFQVTVFNASTGTPTTIDVSDIRLKNIPSNAAAPGHIMADGAYCAVLCDEDETGDGNILKVIDTSGGAPNVISFTRNPSNFSENWQQVAVNAAAQSVAAVVDGKVYLFNIAQPDSDPILFETGEFGVGNTQIAFDGRYVIYHDGATQPNAQVLDTNTGIIRTLTNNPAAGPVAGNNGAFGYFVNMTSADSIGSHMRSGVGAFPGPGATLAVPNQFIDGATTNNGALGFGQTIAVSPNGQYWFLAGQGSVDSGEYLQVNDGSGWKLFADPTDDYGCAGTDVSVSNNTIAFKSGFGTTTVVAYFTLESDGTIATAARTNP